MRRNDFPDVRQRSLEEIDNAHMLLGIWFRIQGLTTLNPTLTVNLKVGVSGLVCARSAKLAAVPAAVAKVSPASTVSSALSSSGSAQRWNEVQVRELDNKGMGISPRILEVHVGKLWMHVRTYACMHGCMYLSACPNDSMHACK